MRDDVKKTLYFLFEMIYTSRGMFRERGKVNGKEGVGTETPSAFFITGAADGNKGAQAMLFITVCELKKRFPSASVYCWDSCARIAEYSFEQVPHPSRLLDYLNAPLAELCKTRLKALLRPSGVSSAVVRFAPHFNKTAAVVDISGFMYASLWPRSVCERGAAFLKAARRFGLPVFMMPQSFGPFEFAKEDEDLIPLLEDVMSYPAIIYAREQQGADMLQTIAPRARIARSHDLVLMSDAVPAESVYRDPAASVHYRDLPQGGHKVGILPNMRTFDHGDKAAILATYRRVVDYLLETEATVYLFRHSVEDLEAARWIKAFYAENPRVILLEDDMNCLEYEYLAAQFDYLIASRFHSIVHAFRRSVPVVALGWAEKYRSLLASVGQERFVFNLADTAAHDSIVSAVQDMEAHWQEERTVIEKNLRKIRGGNCFDFISAYYEQN